MKATVKYASVFLMGMVVLLVLALLVRRPKATVEPLQSVESEVGAASADNQIVEPGPTTLPNPALDIALAAGLEAKGFEQSKMRETHLVDWKFTGKPKYFTPADFERAKEILNAHYERFKNVKSVEYQKKGSVTALVDNAYVRKLLGLRSIDNYDLQIKGNRDPLYVGIVGTMGNVKFGEAVTPAGTFTSAKGGRNVESWIPSILEGENAFCEKTILQYGNRVKSDVAFDIKPPADEFAGVVQSRQASRYNVIEKDNSKDPPPYVESLWFNSQTGLLEFVVQKHVSSTPGENKLYGFTAIEYAQDGELAYTKRKLSYCKDMQLRSEETYNKLVVNGRRLE